MAWARFAFAKSRRMNKQEGFQNRALASALALALISLALAACDSAPPTVGVAETSARPTSAPTQIQTPSPNAAPNLNGNTGTRSHAHTVAVADAYLYPCDHPNRNADLHSNAGGNESRGSRCSASGDSSVAAVG